MRAPLTFVVAALVIVVCFVVAALVDVPNPVAFECFEDETTVLVVDVFEPSRDGNGFGNSPGFPLIGGTYCVAVDGLRVP